MTRVGRPVRRSRWPQLAALLAWVLPHACIRAETASASAPQFCRDIAPILFAKCASCHRPGQAAPFSLLSYQDARKHAREIAETTGTRYMPPWLPEPGFGHFAGDRSLSESQIARIQAWAAAGAPEGDPKDLPPTPVFPEGWQLGTPDLVVALPQTYSLGAEGKDVYRNFVFPIPTDRLRYVKAVEFLPGNAPVVHHAFIDVDETRQSRRLAERQNPPGFDGMELPPSAVMPAGQFLGWQPGKRAAFAPEGLSWTLRTNTDLVLQLHLHPSGKPETVQPSLGFYFTDQAPGLPAFRIALQNFRLRIPAGESNYVVEQSYVLPVGLSIRQINTHAHYLAREMDGMAVLPGGGTNWLIRIRNWDFNWQGDYEYAQPVRLPRGARLVMRYTYDNSAANPRNPSHPPKPVNYGLQTTDEMAEMWLQALCDNAADRAALERDYLAYLVREEMGLDAYRISLDPQDAASHTRLGQNLHVLGKLAESMEHLALAVKLAPDSDKAHYELGSLHLAQKHWAEAEREFGEAARLNAYNHEAFGNLAWLYLRSGRAAEAQRCLETVLQINPGDPVATKYLAVLAARKKQGP